MSIQPAECTRGGVSVILDVIESKAPPHRSPSQYGQYNRCPYSYKLARIDDVWQRPAAWLPQGTAVHSAIEAYERSGRDLSIDEALEVYFETFDDSVTDYAEKTPIDYWFGSGPYAADDDIPRRRALGEQQVIRYYEFVADNPDQTVFLMDDGEPCIEYAVEAELGGVPIRGMIDQGINHPKLGLIIRDVKTGNLPGDLFQLVTYAVCLRKKHDLTINFGDYWMGRSGQPTVPFKLTELTEEWLTQEYVKLDQAIKDEEFEPDPEPGKCRFCSVRAACIFAA